MSPPHRAADAGPRGTRGREGRRPRSRLEPGRLFIPETSPALTEEPRSFLGTRLHPGCAFAARTWGLPDAGVSRPVSPWKRAAGRKRPGSHAGP